MMMLTEMGERLEKQDSDTESEIKSSVLALLNVNALCTCMWKYQAGRELRVYRSDFGRRFSQQSIQHTL